MTGRQLAEATGDYRAAGLPMPAERFRELWKATGLSVRDLAAAIGMNGRHADVHLREMLDGVRKVPGPTGIAVMALADGWRPDTWPQADEVGWLIEDCERLAETDVCRPIRMPNPCDGSPGGYNGYGDGFLRCAAMLRRLTGRGE